MRLCLAASSLTLLLSAPIEAQDSSAAAKLMDRAILLLQIGRREEAIAQARKAVDLAPLRAVFHNNLGNIYLISGDTLLAILTYRRAIELGPQYRPAYTNLGNTYSDIGELDSAIIFHRRALALDSTLAIVHINLGSALEKQNQLDESIQHFEHAVAIDSNSAMAWFDLGVGYHRQQRWTEALNAFIAAVELDEFYPHLHEALQIVSREGQGHFEQRASNDPQNAMGHYYLAYALSYQGDWGRAVKEIIRARRLNNAPIFARARVWIESRRRKDNEAIDAARDCVSTDWSCYMVLGYTYERMQRSQEALGASRTAASLNPNVVNVQQTLGVAYMMSGAADSAIAAFERALTLGSQHPLVRFNLVILYRDIGNYDQAWRHARILERVGYRDAQPLIQELARRSPEPTW